MPASRKPNTNRETSAKTKTVRNEEETSLTQSLRVALRRCMRLRVAQLRKTRRIAVMRPHAMRYRERSKNMTVIMRSARKPKKSFAMICLRNRSLASEAIPK